MQQIIHVMEEIGRFMVILIKESMIFGKISKNSQLVLRKSILPM
jgi:hypothetical protein